MASLSDEDIVNELLSRRAARRSLLPFAERVFPKWETGEHHKQIADHLEAVERGDISRLMIFAPPRHTKSLLASQLFPAWAMGRDPVRQFICCSHTAQLAEDFSARARNICKDEVYRRIFPDCVVDQNSQAANRWMTTRGGVEVAAGVGGAINGRGADIGIIDDAVKGRLDAESPRMREVAWLWYTGDFLNRLQPNASIIFMMTRWHEDDLAGRALEMEPWTVLRLRAIEEEGTEKERALWPEWWPLDVLQDKRDKLARVGRHREWLALYQQEPTTDSGTYIQREWFEDRYEKAPSPLRVYLASDFAVTEPAEGRDPDWTEHGVFGVDQEGAVYVLDWWSGRTTPEVWVESLLDLVKRWKPSAWFGEGGVIRRSVEGMIRRRRKERRIYMRTEWLNPSRDKAARGRAFQAYASSRRIFFPKDRLWADRVIDQCVGFPGAAHDDKFDVMATILGAIDQAHPAIAPTSVEHEPRIARDYSAVETDHLDGWKTA